MQNASLILNIDIDKIRNTKTNFMCFIKFSGKFSAQTDFIINLYVHKIVIT